MHRLCVWFVVVHQAGIELCLSGSGESLALDDVCTAMTYFDILIDGASEILGISTIILTAMTLVILVSLVSLERDSIAAIGESIAEVVFESLILILLPAVVPLLFLTKGL